MWLLDNLKIWVKLPAAMVLIGVLSLFIAEVIATRYTRESVLNAGSERLSAVAEARAGELRAILSGIRADVRANISNPVTLEAARAFVHAHDRYGPGVNAELRRRYAAESSDPSHQRSLLVDPVDRSSYSLVHRRYHDFFATRTLGRGYADLYLVAPDGRIVYSVRKGALFARNILTEPALEPAFAKVVREAASGEGPYPDAFSDFHAGPEDHTASSLFAVPVRSPLGTIEAVIVKRVSIARLEEIMGRPSGLGRSGEVFLVGEDGRLRTWPGLSRDRIPDLAEVEMAPALLGLSGQSGVLRHPDPSGRMLLTAVAPVELPGLRFAVLSRKSEDEILTAAARIRDGMLNDGIVALAFVSVLGLALARSMSVPLTRVGEAMAHVSAGDYDVSIPDRKRRDEIGEIARRLDTFRASLLVAESVMRENAFKGSAFQSSASALMIVDRDLAIIHANGAMVDLMTRNRIPIDRYVPDFCPEALSGRNLTVFFPGAASLPDQTTEGVPNLAEVRFGQRHFRLAISPVRDGDGRHMGYVVEWDDFTDEHMNEVLLEVVDRHFPIAGFSADGRLLSANPLFETWCGAEPGALAGRSWDWLFCGADREQPAPSNPTWAAVVLRPPGQSIELTSRGKHPTSLFARLSVVTGLQRYILIASHWASNTTDASSQPDLLRLSGARA